MTDRDRKPCFCGTVMVIVTDSRAAQKTAYLLALPLLVKYEGVFKMGLKGCFFFDSSIPHCVLPGLLSYKLFNFHEKQFSEFV